MTYYRAHCDEAVDERSLESLRDRCAEVLHEALPAPARELDRAAVREALIAALRFTAFADAEPTLAGLRAAGCSIAVVSNWDVSLHGVLRETGLAGHVDAVLTSAEEGVGKPGPEIFQRALERLGGVAPADAMHVGDDVDSDARGALAASIAPRARRSWRPRRRTGRGARRRLADGTAARRLTRPRGTPAGSSVAQVPLRSTF